MSERRRKDRYNETWTKEELTESLKKIDKTSSHRSDKSTRQRDKDDEKRERKKEEKEQSSHKSRSKRPDSSDRHPGLNEEERLQDHHSRRDQDGARRKNGRSGKHDNDEPNINGDDRHHSRRERPKQDDKYREDIASKHSSKDERHADDHKRNKRSDDKHPDRKHKDERYERESKNENERRRERDHKGRRKEEDERYDDDHKRNKRSDDKHPDRKHKDERESRTENERKRRERDHKGRRKEEDERYDDDSHHKNRRQHDEDRRDRKDRRQDEGHSERESNREDNRRRREREHKKREEEDEEEHRKRRERRRIEKEVEYERKKTKDNEIGKDSRHRKTDRNDEKEPRSSGKRESERDKRKDEKHRKESRRDRHDDSSSISTKSKQSSNTSVTKNKSGQEKEDEYNYDDEEFEDYADDFEDDDEELPAKLPAKGQDKMDELMQAIAAENERANSAHSSGRFRSTATSDRNDSASSYDDSTRENSNEGQLTMINFSAAKKSSASSKVKKKMIKRSKDLMNLMQLDYVAFDILEMAPVTEYNLYIKNYGNSNTAQASVQCNDDNMDQDIQTEIPDLEDKWSQHPPHEIRCSGGEKVSLEETDIADRERLLATMRGDSIRLTKFLSRASKLIESIINDDEMWEISNKDNKERSKLSFCEGYVSLQTNLAYLQGRKAVHIASSQGSSQNLVAVAFEPASTSFSTRIDRKGLVAVWDSRKPTIPEKILVCDACPTYCSFGFSKAYILFVGTDDGCLLAYDLREPGVHHQIVSLEKTRETILRSPTYTTGYLEDGHSSPIVSILSIGADSKSSEEKQMMQLSIDRQNHSGLAFQLASLEEAAKLCIWIVVEMLPEAEPDDDIGLAPNGRIKLIRTMNHSIKAPINLSIPDLQFRTTCMQFSFIDPNNFYVGTDTGHIVHCTQYQAMLEDQAVARTGYSKDGSVFFNEINAVSPVTSIDINPFQVFGASLILAGYEDGSLRLYLSDRELPVIDWPFSTEGAKVVKVQWSSIRPSVFFVLDSSHKIHVWDLAIMHVGPIKTELSQSKPVCLFALSNASPSRSPEIALAYEESTSNGLSMVEVHKLSPHFTQVTDSHELEQLTFLLQSLL